MARFPVGSTLAVLVCVMAGAWVGPSPRQLSVLVPNAGWAHESSPRSTAADSASHVASSDTAAIERAAATLAARAESATPETVAVEREASVPVFLGGREIFRVRVGRDGLTTSERAEAIRARLTTAVGRRTVSADSVHLLSTPSGIEVRLGGLFLWLITPTDIADLDPAKLATEVADLPMRIREGILKERSARRPISILVSILIVIGITSAAWLVVRVLLVLNRRWRAWLKTTLPRYLKGIRLRGFEVLSQAQLIGLVGGLLRRLDVIVGLILLYVYITLVLSLFPWTQGWSWRLFAFAVGTVTDIARALGGAVPGLLVVGLIAAVFRWLIGLSDRFFDAIAAGALAVSNFHPELAMPSKRIARILLWIVAAIIAYPYIPGAESKAVQGVSLLIGVMISIGSTGFVGNIISGIVLTYARSFRVGDRVRIGDHLGDITGLGFFATKIRTIRNEEVTLPNGLVASNTITNYTRLAGEHGLILHTEITIGYDADWREVHKLLIEAAERVEGIEGDPRPWVFQRSLNDFHVSYELNCVTRLSHEQLRLYSDLHQEVQDAFARAGVEILSPGYHAIRDANAPVLPTEPAGPRAKPSGFRVAPRDS